MQTCERVLRGVILGMITGLALVGIVQAAPPEMEDWAWAAWSPTPTSLTWYPKIPGDYDLNGEVNIADVTALGMHFGETSMDGWPHGIVDQLIDLDQNGEINISDLTAIGRYFGIDCLGGFNVYRNDGSTEQLAHVEFTSGYRTGQGWFAVSFNLGANPGSEFTIQPVDYLGVEGAHSVALHRRPPSSQRSITYPEFNSSTGLLSWHYANQGDTDQSGMVREDPWADELSGDLILIVEHWGELGHWDFNTSLLYFPWVSAESLIDVDGNGEVGIADIVIWSSNGNSVHGYNIYGSDIEPIDGEIPGSIYLGSAGFSEAQGDRVTDRLWFTYDLGTPAPARYLWVVPFFEDLEGVPSYVWDAELEDWTQELPLWIGF